MCDPMTKLSIHMVREDVTAQLAVADRLISSIERGIDINQRLTSMYKPNDAVASEIINYIQEYEDACESLGFAKIKIEASVESAWSIVRNIVRALWTMLCKLWDSIRNALRYVFNASYRASKDAVKIRQEIELLAASKSNSDKFLMLEVDAAMSPDDVEKYIKATRKLISNMQEVEEMDNPETIESYISTHVAEAGIVWKNNQFVDTYDKVPYHGGTYMSIGWKTFKLIQEQCDSYVKLTAESVKLKKLASELDSDIKDLTRKQNNLIADGADITEVQKTLTLKVKKYSVIKASLEVLLQRLDVLEEEFSCLAEDAHDIAHGVYEDDSE